MTKKNSNTHSYSYYLALTFRLLMVGTGGYYIYRAVEGYVSEFTRIFFELGYDQLFGIPKWYSPSFIFIFVPARSHVAATALAWTSTILTAITGTLLYRYRNKFSSHESAATETFSGQNNNRNISQQEKLEKMLSPSQELLSAGPGAAGSSRASSDGFMSCEDGIKGIAKEDPNASAVCQMKREQTLIVRNSDGSITTKKAGTQQTATLRSTPEGQEINVTERTLATSSDMGKETNNDQKTSASSSGWRTGWGLLNRA